MENIQIRITQIRGINGELNIIPNGSIVNVINHSRGNSTAVVLVEADYAQDVDKVLQSVHDGCDRFMRTFKNAVRPPVVQGVQNIANGIITIRVLCDVKPLCQWDAERVLRRCIKEQFDEDGVRPPVARQVFLDAKEQAAKPPSSDVS